MLSHPLVFIIISKQFHYCQLLNHNKCNPFTYKLILNIFFTEMAFVRSILIECFQCMSELLVFDINWSCSYFYFRMDGNKDLFEMMKKQNAVNLCWKIFQQNRRISFILKKIPWKHTTSLTMILYQSGSPNITSSFICSHLIHLNWMQSIWKSLGPWPKPLYLGEFWYIVNWNKNGFLISWKVFLWAIEGLHLKTGKLQSSCF